MKVLLYGIEDELILEKEAAGAEEILRLLREISRNRFIQFV